MTTPFLFDYWYEGSKSSPSRLPEIQDELERSIFTTRNLLGQLPRAPSSDPRGEISTLLHMFTSDLLRHVEGVPDDEHSTFGSGIGLIQAIRPAQERFRRAIRETAPNFKPFERGSGGKKHLPRPAFLRSEDGDEGEETDDEEDEGSNTEGEESANYGFFGLAGRKRKIPSGEVIYIDDVLDRAHRSVCFIYMYSIMAYTLLQRTDSRAARKLSLCRSKDLHRRHHQGMARSCQNPLQNCSRHHR